MTKQEFVEELAERCELSKAESGRTVDAILDSIVEALEKKDEVGFPGFGKFATQRRKAREATNPRDPGQTVHVPATIVPKFKPGTRLKEAVAQSSPSSGSGRSRQSTQASANQGGDDGQATATRGEWKPLSKRR
jgi:DNA-binding protein HU-beta